MSLWVFEKWVIEFIHTVLTASLDTIRFHWCATSIRTIGMFNTRFTDSRAILSWFYIVEMFDPCSVANVGCKVCFLEVSDRTLVIIGKEWVVLLQGISALIACIWETFTCSIKLTVVTPNRWVLTAKILAPLWSWYLHNKLLLKIRCYLTRSTLRSYRPIHYNLQTRTRSFFVRRQSKWLQIVRRLFSSYI